MRIINKVETNLTRRMFLPARTQLRYPTRNKKNRLKRLPLDIHTGAGAETRLIPIEDYPGMIVTLRFPLPTILLGLPPTEEPLTGGVAIATLPSFGENLNKHPRRRVTWKMGGDAETLGRMLGKIAHAYAVAELGLNVFTPYLLNIILDRAPRYPKHYVGGEIGDPSPASPHRIDPAHSPVRPPGANSLQQQLEPQIDGTTLILVKIRLFADRDGMPSYLIAAGHLNSK